MAKAPIPWRRLLVEGLVIIAGVLIALAADRWQQRADDRALGEIYLQRLADELLGADSILDRAAVAAEARLTGAQLVIDALDGAVEDSTPARELVLGMALAYWLQDPEVPREAWSELVASGRLGLIESTEVRQQIAMFYRLVDQQAEFHLEWVDYVLPYRRAVNTILDPNLLLAVAKERLDGDAIPEDLLPTTSDLIRDIQESPNLRATMGDLLTNNWAGAWQYRRLSERARTIEALIRVELAD